MRKVIAFALLCLLFLSLPIQGQVTNTTTTDFSLLNRTDNDPRLVIDAPPFIMWDNRYGKILSTLLVDIDSITAYTAGASRSWELSVTSEGTGTRRNIGLRMIERGAGINPIIRTNTVLADTVLSIWTPSVFPGFSFILNPYDSLSTTSRTFIYYNRHRFVEGSSAGAIATFSHQPIDSATVLVSDTLASAADTVLTLGFNGGKKYKTLLFTVTGTTSDSCTAEVGYQVKQVGGSWAWSGEVGSKLTVLSDSLFFPLDHECAYTVSGVDMADSVRVSFVRNLRTGRLIVNSAKVLLRD